MMKMRRKAVADKSGVSATGKYPVINPADAEMAVIVERLCNDIEAFKTLKERMQLDKPELLLKWAPSYYHLCKKVSARIKSVLIRSGDDELLVSQHWSMDSGDPKRLDVHGIMKIVGKKHFDLWFETMPTLSINFGLVPKEQRNKIVKAISDLMAENGCAAAVSPDRVFRPTERFWTERHNLTVEANLKLDTVLPPHRTVKMLKHGTKQAKPSKAKTASAHS